jgi:hypothetical protein
MAEGKIFSENLLKGQTTEIKTQFKIIQFQGFCFSLIAEPIGEFPEK